MFAQVLGSDVSLKCYADKTSGLFATISSLDAVPLSSTSFLEKTYWSFAASYKSSNLTVESLLALEFELGYKSET